MGALSGEPVRGAAGYAPLVVRVLVGVVMAAHGWQKLQGGPANFGQALAGLGRHQSEYFERERLPRQEG